MGNSCFLFGDGAAAPFFTVIIPMYNVGHLVAECLQSVYMQDMAEDEYEVIVINDCSTDDSCLYAEEAANGHPNTVIVCRQENGCCGGARNTALKQAHGRYVLFLDADDFWQYTDTLSIFRKVIEATDADVIDNNLINGVCYDATLSRQTYGPAVKFLSVGCDELLDKPDFKPYPAWNAAYRLDTIIRNGVWFAEHVQYEDVDWRMRIVYAAKSIACVSFPYYCYRKNPKSILNKPSTKLMHDAVRCYTRIYDFASGDIRKTAKSYLCSWILYNVTSFPMLSRVYTLRESMIAISTMAKAGLLSKETYVSLCPDIRFSLRNKVVLYILKEMPKVLLVPYRVAMLVKDAIRSRIG